MFDKIIFISLSLFYSWHINLEKWTMYFSKNIYLVIEGKFRYWESISRLIFKNKIQLVFLQEKKEQKLNIH